jgi:hypothetical protein
VGVLLKEAVQIQKVYAIPHNNLFTFDFVMLQHISKQSVYCSILLIIKGLVCVSNFGAF